MKQYKSALSVFGPTKLRYSFIGWWVMDSSIWSHFHTLSCLPCASEGCTWQYS